MDYILYFAITIGILVFIHEFGHFAAAKLSGMRVDVFAIGFGKRLFGWNKVTGFSFGDLPKDLELNGNTDYRVSLLPLGGYVKIAGIIDENYDKDYATTEPQPWEFRSKSTPKKIFVLIAGVLMNLFLTIAIFWGINYFQGRQVIETTKIGTVADTTAAYSLGFRTGDKILAINGEKVNDWESVLSELISGEKEKTEIEILRNGKDTTLTVSARKIKEIAKNGYFLPIGDTRPVINMVMDNSPAEDAGIKDGDILLSINNQPLKSVHDVIKIVSSHKEQTIPVTLVRDSDTLTLSVTPNMDGLIGVSLSETYTGKVSYRRYGFFEAFEQALVNIRDYTLLTYTMIKKVVKGDIAFGSAFGGPVKIAKFAAKSAENGMISFLYFLAALSLSLAIINIIPFPGLDGGHLVIVLIEAVLRRELSIKVKMAIQNIGFVLLLLLTAIIIYNDIISM
jgi:regulator of sigma E protease